MLFFLCNKVRCTEDMPEMQMQLLSNDKQEGIQKEVLCWSCKYECDHDLLSETMLRILEMNELDQITVGPQNVNLCGICKQFINDIADIQWIHILGRTNANGAMMDEIEFSTNCLSLLEEYIND